MLAAVQYDPFGRQIAKTVDGVATAYVYDGKDIQLEYADGVLLRRWVHGAQVDELLAFEQYAGTQAAGSGMSFEMFANRKLVSTQ